MKEEASVTNEYSCPLCSSKPHDGFFFYENSLIGQPVCEDCDGDFDYWVETGKVDAEFIERVEKHTGLSWYECRKILLEQEIDSLEAFENEGFEAWFEETLKHERWTRDEALAHLRRKADWQKERLRNHKF